MCKRVVKNVAPLARARCAQKILADIKQYFSDADAWGLSWAEADPNGVMQKTRTALEAMLVKEGRMSSTPYGSAQE